MEGHAITVYRNDIETNPRLRSDDLSVIGRDRADRPAFPAVNRRDGRPESRAFPALHLDEDQRTCVHTYNIDLAARRAQVARNNLISVLPLEESDGHILT